MEPNYRTVAKSASASFIEKKSEFIGHISPCKTEEEALDFIREIKKQHRKATHNCYAYILRSNNIGRHSDDGEPSGTAGAPMFEVLRKEGLTDVCCVVTRYFGGILLGAGGRVRAYTNGVKAAVDAAGIKEMRMAALIGITLDYSLYGRLGSIFSDYDVRIRNEDFSSDVKINLYIDEKLTEEFKEKITDICFGRVNIRVIEKTEFDFGKSGIDCRSE